MIDLYELLNVDSESSERMVRSAIEVSREILDGDEALSPDSAEAAKRRLDLDLAERVLLDEDRRKDYDQAIKLAGALKSTQTASVNVLTERAAALSSKGKASAQAIVLAERALEIDSSNSRASLVLGVANYEWGDAHEGVRAVRQAIRLDPSNSLAHGVLADILRTQKQFDDAIAAYERCFQLDPEAREAFGVDYARCLRATQQVEKAIEFLEEQRRVKPDQVEIDNALAMAYGESAYAGWTKVEEGHKLLHSGYYATSLEHILVAEQALAKALPLQFDDADVASALSSVKQDIDRMSERKFVANWKVAAIAAGIGLLMVNGRETVGMGIVVLVGTGLYVGSSFVPYYIINRQLLRERDFNDFDWVARIFDLGRKFDNTLSNALLFGFMFMVYTIAVPFFGVYNLYRYHGDAIRRWLTSTQNREKVSALMAKLQATTRATTQAASGALEGIKAKVKESRKVEPGSTGANKLPSIGISGPDRGRSGPTRADVKVDTPVSLQAPTNVAVATFPAQEKTAKPADPVTLAGPSRRMGQPVVILVAAVALVLGGGGAGYWAWIEKQKADALDRQMEERRIADAKRMEEEAASRELELRQKLKEEEDRRQKAEQDRLAAEARAAEEARVRRQAETRAAEEAIARRQAESTAMAAARAREEAQRAAQTAKDVRAAVPPMRGPTGYQAASAAAGRGDYAGAQAACLNPAQAGDAHCQFLMGVLYAKGQVGSGSASDLRTAADWFKQSAQQNVAQAQFNLAVMYERGAGVPRDLNAARTWYQRAAAQGEPNAAVALARLGSGAR